MAPFSKMSRFDWAEARPTFRGRRYNRKLAASTRAAGQKSGGPRRPVGAESRIPRASQVSSSGAMSPSMRVVTSSSSDSSSSRKGSSAASSSASSSISSTTGSAAAFSSPASTSSSRTPSAPAGGAPGPLLAIVDPRPGGGLLLARLDLVERHHFDAGRRRNLGLLFFLGLGGWSRPRRGRDLEHGPAFRADDGVLVEIKEFRAAVLALMFGSEFGFGQGDLFPVVEDAIWAEVRLRSEE